jgi:hypothetical protein
LYFASKVMDSLNFALPYNHESPTTYQKRGLIFLVAAAIAFQLGPPKVETGFRQAREFARWGRVPVPKASMNKKRLAKSRKHKIGTPWQIAVVKTIPITHAMNKTAHHHFGFGVLTADAPHAFATLGGGEGINHFNAKASQTAPDSSRCK